MKFLKLLFLLAMLISFSAITLSATPTEEVSFPDFYFEDKKNSDHHQTESQETTSSLRGTNRVLAQTRAFMAFEGIHLYDPIKAAEICLVPNVVIPKNFRVPEFVK